MDIVSVAPKIQKCQTPERSHSDLEAAFAPLEKRGIFWPAADMDWNAGRNGWDYPVYDEDGQTIARRFKNYDSQADKKYLWLHGSKARFYHCGAGLKEAIKQWDGELFIVNGEPAVLTMHALGLYNVISFFGEQNIPDYFTTTLLAWGVEWVRYYPDKDDTGLRAAIKLRDVVAGCGRPIDFDCFELPDSVPAGGDLNDLWQALNFDEQAMLDALQEMPFKTLPKSEPKPAKIEYSAAGEGGDLPSALIRDIEKTLPTAKREPRLKPYGWLGAFQCPVGHHTHDDTKPAAYWNIKTNSLTCHKCGQTYNAHTTATALGLDVSSYYPKRAEKSAEADFASVVQTTEASDKYLSDAILSSILRCHPKVAPLFYIVANAGLETFTREQMKAVAVARGMSEVTFNRSWPLLFSPELSLLECIREGVIPSKSDNCRILAPNQIIAQLRTMEAKRVNVEYHPTGAPPKSGEEDTRVVALQTAEMIRDSGIEEDPAPIAAELNQKLQPAFNAQKHAELHTRAAALREFRRICDSFDDTSQTFIPDDARVHTVPDLRAAYANAYASDHDGERISRNDWRRLLGCSNAALKDILARAGVKGETPSDEIALDIKTPSDIERIISHGRVVKGFPLKVVYTAPDGQEVQRGIDARSNPQGMHRVCEMALQSGTAVKVLYQTAKEYHVESAPLPTKERVKNTDVISNSDKLSDLSTMVDIRQIDEIEPADPRKYPRRWLVGQYQLALERMGWKRDKFGVYDSDGVYAPDNPRQLIELILGRSLETVTGDRDPDFYDRPSTEYELNARHDFRMQMIGQGWRLKHATQTV